MSKGSKDSQLLALLGEELKQPLVAIAQLAEINGSDEITIQAKKALRTIDNVLLYRRISSGQQVMRLEPVHVGSAMESVFQAMKPLMSQSGCVSELKIQHSLQPVDVDRRLLRGVIESMWQAFSLSVNAPASIVCKATKTTKGIRVSMSSESAQLDEVHFARVNIDSVQPLSSFAGPAADIITAKELCHLLGATLSKTTKSIGVTLPPSKQLQMV